MRCAGAGRAAARMRDRLADAFWQVLEDNRLDDVSVGAVCEAAGVSRGSFYYHFSDRAELLRWALRREILDADGRGTPLVQVAASEPVGGEDECATRSIARLCLLIDHGGMDVVYNAVVETALDFWRSAVGVGDDLPDGVVAAIEYDVGGLVGTLCRVDSASPEQRRSLTGHLRSCHGLLARRVCREMGISPTELRARLEVVCPEPACPVPA